MKRKSPPPIEHPKGDKPYDPTLYTIDDIVRAFIPKKPAKKEEEGREGYLAIRSSLSSMRLRVRAIDANCWRSSAT